MFGYTRFVLIFIVIVVGFVQAETADILPGPLRHLRENVLEEDESEPDRVNSTRFAYKFRKFLSRSVSQLSESVCEHGQQALVCFAAMHREGFLVILVFLNIEKLSHFKE